MRPSKYYYCVALDCYKYYCSDSERELTFEANLPTNLGELTFKNISKWGLDQSGVACDSLGKAIGAMPIAPTYRGASLIRKRHSPRIIIKT